MKLIDMQQYKTDNNNMRQVMQAFIAEKINSDIIILATDGDELNICTSLDFMEDDVYKVMGILEFAKNRVAQGEL